MMKKLSIKAVKALGNSLGVDWSKVNIKELRKGIVVELEHRDVTGGDLIMTTQIALAHLKELPDYYTRLEKMESGLK